MADREKARVRIDATGTAHPVGREASRQMRLRQGNLELMPAPSSMLLLRTLEPREEERSFWLTGEVTRPGVLWDLIGIAGQGNWSGLLTVSSGPNERQIFFERGALIGANSSADRERLGEVLFHYGVIEQKQIEVIADAVTKDMRFGEAAVALGFITREDLFDFIGKQAEEIVYATMLVGEGHFSFEEDFDPSQLSYRLNLNVQHLLMEGVRRMDEIELFRARIPSGLHVPERVEGQIVDPDHEHRKIWLAVDGQRSVEEVARQASLSVFDATRSLFQLVQSGDLLIRPPRPTGAHAMVTLFNQAIALILKKVDTIGGGEDVREQLASFATASGVYDALFRDAGPAEDGTLDADKVAETVQRLAGEGSALDLLGQWLYEYASFAMFIAEPLLRSRLADAEASGPISEGVLVSRRVAELLAPLAPEV
ncbi:MAG: DUF4388 domain-containing protein [Myxococcota bacterium]